MASGGKRIGAGRPAGAKNKVKHRKINVQEIMDRVGMGPDAMPLPFLLAVVHAPEGDVTMSERIQCAIAAAPYCHSKQATVQIKQEGGSILTVDSDLSKALHQLAEIARLREVPVIDGQILEPSTLGVGDDSHTEGRDDGVG